MTEISLKKEENKLSIIEKLFRMGDRVVAAKAEDISKMYIGLTLGFLSLLNGDEKTSVGRLQDGINAMNLVEQIQEA